MSISVRHKSISDFRYSSMGNLKGYVQVTVVDEIVSQSNASWYSNFTLVRECLKCSIVCVTLCILFLSDYVYQ